jgi:hypothetical protein
MIGEIMAARLILCGRIDGNNVDGSRQSSGALCKYSRMDIVSSGHWQIRQNLLPCAQRVIEESPLLPEFAFASGQHVLWSFLLNIA